MNNYCFQNNKYFIHFPSVSDTQVGTGLFIQLHVFRKRSKAMWHSQRLHLWDWLARQQLWWWYRWMWARRQFVFGYKDEVFQCTWFLPLCLYWWLWVGRRWLLQRFVCCPCGSFLSKCYAVLDMCFKFNQAFSKCHIITGLFL